MYCSLVLKENSPTPSNHKKCVGRISEYYFFNVGNVMTIDYDGDDDYDGDNDDNDDRFLSMYICLHLASFYYCFQTISQRVIFEQEEVPGITVNVVPSACTGGL